MDLRTRKRRDCRTPDRGNSRLSINAGSFSSIKRRSAAAGSFTASPISSRRTCSSRLPPDPYAYAHIQIRPLSSCNFDLPLSVHFLFYEFYSSFILTDFPWKSNPKSPGREIFPSLYILFRSAISAILASFNRVSPFTRE